MKVPSTVMVKVDRQGRLVVPHNWREVVTTTPGAVQMTQTDEGLLITPIPTQGEVATGVDGLPILRLGRLVTNAVVLAAIDAERKSR